MNPTNPETMKVERQNMLAAARFLGMELIVVNASTASEIERVFAAAAQLRAAAMYVGSDAFLVSQRAHIAALGLRTRSPRSHQAATTSWLAN